MTAYNLKSLDAMLIMRTCDEAYRLRLISEEEYTRVKQAYPLELYVPNMFIRIGLFLAMCVLIFMSFGLLMIFFGDAWFSDSSMSLTCLLYALALYGALEWFIREKKHFRSGVDDALLWVSAGFLVVSFYLAAFNASATIQCLVFLAISTLAAIRFANAVMSIVMFLSFVSLIFFQVTSIGPLGMLLAPFIVAAASFGVYLFVSKQKTKERFRHYATCFAYVEVCALLSIYLSFNYFAAHEIQNEFFFISIRAGEALTGGWLFWIMTLLLPPLYIVRGLQTRDAVLLRAGIVLLFATIFTIRYYYHWFPPEYLMTLGGSLLIIAMYLSIRRFRHAHTRITSNRTDTDVEHGSIVEQLVVAESFDPKLPSDDGFRFGGGSSGGGGATGNY
jgi:uncharacterized membrane protein YgcG